MFCITLMYLITLCNSLGCFERKQSPNTMKPVTQFALLLTTCPFSPASRARCLSARPFTDSLNISTYFLLHMSLCVLLGRCVYRGLVSTANETSPLWVEAAPLSLRALRFPLSVLLRFAALLNASTCFLMRFTPGVSSLSAPLLASDSLLALSLFSLSDPWDSQSDPDLTDPPSLTSPSTSSSLHSNAAFSCSPDPAACAPG
ncbi:hypothetical protein FKM82_025725 [Ascaphus truei]